MNTYDGRIFFEKSSSNESIQEILATNTGRAITGSLNLNGSITSSGVLVSANIMPNADNTLSLGSSTQRFQLNGGTPVTVDGSGTANTLTRFQSATTVEDSNIVSSDTATTLTHSNNGNIIFTVSGSNGELFTVTDSNSGNLLEVNDTSGIDVFTVSATGDVSASGAITASGITGLTSLTVNGNISGSSFNGTGLISGSTQLSGYISASGGFTANETIIATGTNSVTSSNILALDTTNNYLGINQTSPEVTLHMTGEGAQSAQIRMEQHNDTGDAPDIRTRKSRGTSAAPTKNNAGDFIYRQNSERYNGSSYVTVGQLAIDTNSSNADRFQLTLTVSEDGGSIDAANNQFKIDGNDGGAITFNNAYKFPTSDGTNGQALITNGSGVLSFGDVTSDYTELTNIPSGIISASAEGSSQGQITLNGSAVNVNALGTNDSPQFTNLTLTGDLTVSGTTTTVNSTTVNIGDNILELNYGGSATTGGIYVKDGTGASTTSGSLLWDATNDYWKAGKLGSESEVITTSNIVTNLPNGSVSGSSQIFSDISGDITIASNGTAAIGNGVIVNADINSSAAIASSKIDYDGTGIVSGSQQIKDLDFVDLSSTQTITGAKTFNASGNSIIVGDTLRIAEDGSGMRMTNVGAFESSSQGFHIFSNADLRLSTNGSGAGTTAVIFDQTTKDATFEGNILAGNISGSSFNGTGLLSGSITDQLPSGVISGSNQVVSSLLNQTVNFGTGQVTASYFSGDGSGLTNVTATISENATVTGSFSNASSFTINHNFNSKNVLVSVYDNNDSQIIPQEITLSDNDNVDITLSAAQSGFVVVAKGGHIVSGSANDASNLNGQPATYYLDYTNFNNVPSGIVSGSTQITDLTTHKETVSGNTSYAVTHNLNEQYPIVQAWNTSTSQQVIPESITTNSANQVTVTFVANFAGVIIVKK